MGTLSTKENEKTNKAKLLEANVLNGLNLYISHIYIIMSVCYNLSFFMIFAFLEGGLSRMGSLTLTNRPCGNGFLFHFAIKLY